MFTSHHQLSSLLERRWLGATLAILLGLSLLPAQAAIAQESTGDPAQTAPGAVYLPVVLDKNWTAAANVQANPIFLPLIVDQPCDVNLNYRSTPFGVQVYGATGATTPYHCALMHSRATWIRNVLVWRSVEPENTEPENFRWENADAAFRVARDNRINIIGTMEYNPEWAATEENGPIDKTSLAELAEFMGAAAERYDGDGVLDAPGSPRIFYWELYNEPDRGPGPTQTRWGEHGGEYAQMLAAVYPAIKAANPQAKVVMGGLAYDWFEDQGGPFVRSFLDDVLKAGGGTHFDVMNFHAYPTFAGNWGAPNGPGILEKTQAVRTKLKEYGLEKPIVITEAGMHSNDVPSDPMTPELQARYVVQVFTQALAGKIEVLIWWMLHDAGGGYPYDNGLVTRAVNETYEKKPAFFAYQVASQEFSTAKLDAVLSAEETGDANLQVYRFVRDNAPRKLYVAWYGKVNATQTAPLRLQGTTATLRNIYGSATKVTDSTDGSVDGYITLTIGAQPVYVEMP